MKYSEDIASPQQMVYSFELLLCGSQCPMARKRLKLGPHRPKKVP